MIDKFLSFVYNFTKGEDYMENYVLLWIQENLRTPVLTDFFRFMTTLGNSGIIWIIITVLLLCIKNYRKIGIASAVSLVSSLVVNNIVLKNLIARPRPYTLIQGLTILTNPPADFSFPSGHTAASFACATVLFLMLPKKYGVPALILATLISFSRLYLGVHFPTDVLAGLISGVILGAISYELVSKKFFRQK